MFPDLPTTDVTELPIPPELRNEYPFALRSLDIDGLRYAYVDEGTGPVLLFVHGNPTWSFAWRNLIKDLSRDHRTIAVDHIGMGRSDKPNEYGYRIDQHISNLSRLILELNLSEITLIGHDWGGCIGMGAAVRAPQRFARFVMMNTAAFRSQRMPIRIAVCRIPYLGALGVRGLNLFSRAALRMAVEKPLSPAVQKGYLLPYDSWQNRQAVHRFVQEIPIRAEHPTYETLVEVEQGLPQFQDHPLLLIWGEKDWCFTTEFLDEWEHRFPLAETLRIEKAGHYVFEDAPEEIVARLRMFLIEHASAEA